MNGMDVESMSLVSAILLFAKKDRGGQRKPWHWSQFPDLDSVQSPKKYKLELYFFLLVQYFRKSDFCQCEWSRVEYQLHSTRYKTGDRRNCSQQNKALWVLDLLRRM